VTDRVSVLELYVLLEGEVIPNPPRGPSKNALVVDTEEGFAVCVGVGVIAGDDVGIGEVLGKEL
jgi:hypothetical protein